MNTSLNLYLIRHGETKWNVEGLMQGRKDSQLTLKGIRDTKKLADQLKDIEFQLFISSPLQRALTTTKILAEDRDINIVTDDDLLEMDFGLWEGMSHKEIKKKFPSQSNYFWNYPHLYNPLKGETFFDVKRRVMSFLNRVCVSYPNGGNILIVSHAIVIKIIMTYFSELPLEKLWENQHIKGTSLSLIEINKKKNSIILYGDCSHI